MQKYPDELTSLAQAEYRQPKHVWLILQAQTIFFKKTIKTKKMETKKMSLANVQGKLSRAEMKKVMAGAESLECDDDLKPICTACTSDSGCPAMKVCRSSPSCTELKVCAKPLYC